MFEIIFVKPKIIQILLKLHFLFQIIFPDLSDANIKPIDKSQVTITGIIDGVYMARQQLIVSDSFNYYVCLLKTFIKTTNVQYKKSFCFLEEKIVTTFSLFCEQGKLPVALIFDYPEKSVKQESIVTLMNKLGVLITVREKQRQSTLCIIIKGIEKYVGK